MLSIENVNKIFNNRPVLQNINIKIEKGESVVILGPSGSGKSVLLKIIMGIMSPTSGRIKINNATVNFCESNYIFQNNKQTKMGFMFQNCALFDSMSVYENVRFYLDYHNLYTEDLRHRTAITALKSVNLDNQMHYSISELSGGMIKRVALARILAYKPEIIILDEPTSGLDDSTTKEVVKSIREIWRTENFTCITVTHDSYCAEKLGDRIFIKEGTCIKEKTKVYA